MTVPAAMDSDFVPRVRSFNRAVTQRIGALENGFLGRGRPLGASRVLFEIGVAGTQVRELRDRLGLDSGYVSRLLRALEREGLVRTRRSREDARVRRLQLTAAGRRELATLDSLSDRAAASILEPLNARQRDALTEAMSVVERLLEAGSVSISVEDPGGPAAQECLHLYYAELARRFEHGFDPGASISATADELTPPNGYFLVARLHGAPVGCGALKCHPDFGEVKRMWVAETARGLGIGRRLLGRLEDLARERALPLLRLETNESLKEAQALYRSSGYREVPAFNQEPYAHHWFEKGLPAAAQAD
ncbi:MAG TPA: helix-turn-helix domain-containing GNAT family N-acetyltransferase [Spirochaetia bacterium]|nr:helix-turn-helix domain-containing GNAT family N-acetyltransferase [Spirochaetia bacterium]